MISEKGKLELVNKAAIEAAKILVLTFDVCELKQYINSTVILTDGREFKLNFKLIKGFQTNLTPPPPPEPRIIKEGFKK